MSSSEIPRKRKHGKTYTSSASESTEDSTGLPTKKPSTSASTWKIEDLDLQSIFFATEYLPMETLISLLKKRRDLEDVPKIVNTLIGFTKECLNFTIDENTWQMCDSSVRPEQEKGIEILINTKKNVRMFANKIRSEEAQLLDEEPINRDLFERWYCKVVDFIDQAVQLLNLLINEALEKIEHKKQTCLLHIKEGSFTYLFMKFTEICFLSPEPGEGAKTDLWIRNKRVGCLPDIRYWQQSSMPNRNILIMLAEVKIAAFRNSENTEEREVSKSKDTSTACTIENTTTTSDEKKPNKTPWIHSKVQPDVLAQLGCEMLAECHNSIFVPEILGILCMKTKVIFNYLQLSNKHFMAIKRSKDIENMRSHIQYTQIFDIMKAEHRNGLLDLLFWLGCVQKKGLQNHYILS
ncbi:uncharacterized protein LOC127730158 isoform X1 [Mytilus californianus]|uniref:uncharacterized protein LOC127730158 isoform X1 n=1 Tax=Mytilus californianus TaxID=6549 RepID=UPI0022453766|nr:uncharacterized protein LOC127730158 isoform X1 [Mytilus californianus]XP_052094374.1 uncharacterized protein LOC127730158 isoform X1 [Mytilus californianus]XP_052094375.1 uncharacterized protein LOC127730158 isoform X1 [Mytilus californianus]